eukprot:m.30444 g.30444  ORF g.30444 m.30444 type:complete len:454 (+) comp9436_c0_seq1:143-1504(+)
MAPKGTKRGASSQEEPVRATALKRPTVAGGVACGFGMNPFGQVGSNVNHTERKKPALLKGGLEGKAVVAVAAGGMHSVALTASGQLYTWGCNDEQALGRHCADEDDYATPGLAQTDDASAKFVAITAGDSHTAALTEDGRVFVCGCFRDSRGTFFFSETTKLQKELTCVFPAAPLEGENPETYPAAREIASGADHIAILAENGKVYTMGCGEQGQLGRVSQRFSERDSRRELSGYDTPAALEKAHTTLAAVRDLLRPHLVSARVLRKVRVEHVFCGTWSTLAVADDGRVFAFGLNNYAQLGVGAAGGNMVFSPLRAVEWESLDGDIVQLAGGQHHTIGLTSGGRVYGIGRGDTGQLGNASTAETSTPVATANLDGRKIVRIGAGSAVSFAIDDKGEGFAWGFGENLQLTAGDEQDRNVPIHVEGKQLQTENRTVVQIDAGGQHALLVAKPASE